MALSKPTNCSNSDYANRIGLLFDAANDAKLDEYETGTFTPSLTFATPGDLSVAYSTRSGFYTVAGNVVFINFTIITSTFTHTTASGNLRMSGFPFTVSASTTSFRHLGPVEWQGVTKANYTDVNIAPVGAATYGNFQACGSAQNVSTVSVADVPTGTTKQFIGNAFYFK